MLTKDQAEAASEALLQDARAKQSAAAQKLVQNSKNHLLAGLCLLVVGGTFSYLAANSSGPQKGRWLLASVFLATAAVQFVIGSRRRNA